MLGEQDNFGKMYLTWLLFLLSFTGCVVGQSGQSGSPTPWPYPTVCAPRNTVTLDPTLPPNTRIPPVPSLPAAFQVLVEGVLIDKKYTVVAEEYYDAFNGRAAIHLLQNGTKMYLIFDYINNQTIYVTNGTCIASSLKFDLNQEYVGLQRIPGHSYSIAKTLHFAKSNGLLYKGRKEVRGIDCDWWQSCIYWPNITSNFTLDYFFSGKEWVVPDATMQVPVLAEVTGVTADFQGKLSPIHHKYEYFDFRSSIPEDDSVFETPPGIVCTGRVQTKQLPTIPEQVSYLEEIVSLENQQVSQAVVFYDHTTKLVRLDYTTYPGTYPYYTSKSELVTEIHDFNTGISYGINTARGNCSIFPISNTTFDASSTIRGKNGNQPSRSFLHMRIPSELFKLDNSTYTYEGTRTVRDIPCEVFISRRTDFVIPGYNAFPSIFEIYFMQRSWISGPSATSVPVQIRLTTPDYVGFNAVYNIYNFVAGAPSLDKFSVSPCYNDTSKKPFKIEFPGMWDNNLKQYKNLLIRQITYTISKVTRLSPLRIQDTQLYVYPSSFFYVAELLETPPSTAYFHKLYGSFTYNQPLNAEKELKVRSSEECAHRCLFATTPCDVFYYCADQHACILSPTNTHNADDPLMPSIKLNCSNYVRTVQMQVFEVALQYAWTTLKNTVFSGQFKLDLNISGQVSTLKAGGIDDVVIQNPQRTLSSSAVMDKFNGQMDKDIPGYDDMIIVYLSVDDCASECLDQQSWVCNSFEYCFDTGYCILSKLHPDQHPSAVKNKGLCDLYSKKYTVDYQQVPGITVHSSSNIIYQNMHSADQCAKLCSQYDDFNCKSFDYCEDISTCYLGRSHYYDVPKADVHHTPHCTHFSRKYLADFKQEKRQKLSTEDVRIIGSVTVDECAKLCVDEEINACARFSYCGNETQCILSTAAMKNVGQVIATPNLWCDLYLRQTFPDGTKYTTPTKSTPCVTPPPSTSRITTTQGHLTSNTSTVTPVNTRLTSTPDSTPIGKMTGNTGSTQDHSRLPASTEHITGKMTGNTGSTQAHSRLPASTEHITGKMAGTTDNTQAHSKLSSSTEHTPGKMSSSSNPSTQKPLNYKNNPPSNNNGLSGGAIAGLAIGMLVGGILIAALVYMGLDKFKRRQPSDMTVAFVKGEVE